MDYFTTTEFMTDLGLDLREQTAFAIIYSFSQDREGCWFGSIATMSKWLGSCTKATTVHTLQRLVEKGLVVKEDFMENGVKYCRYYTSKKIITGYYKNYTGGIIKIKTNNDIDKSISKSNNKDTSRFDFLSNLISIGVTESTAKDWIQVRKAAKAVNTETAFNGIRREIEKCGQTAEACIRLAVENNWRGFKAEWFDNAIRKESSAHQQRAERPSIDEMMRRYGMIKNESNYGPEEQ